MKAAPIARIGEPPDRIMWIVVVRLPGPTERTASRREAPCIPYPGRIDGERTG